MIAALAAVVVAQLAAHVALAVTWARERQRLVDAVVARHAGELAVIRKAERTPTPPGPKPEPIEQIGL
jgi:hypothetical protein